jgi:PAS domain-containing protein
MLNLARQKKNASVEADQEDDPQAAPAGAAIGSLDLQAVFDSITDDICIIDKDYRICHANSSYAALVGKPLETFIGRKCHSILWEREVPCDRCPALETFASGAAVLRKKAVLRHPEKQQHL